MREFVQEMLELTATLKTAYGDCEAFVRARLLLVSLSLLQVVRRTVILHDVMMMACFLWALSFFTTGLVLCLPAALGPGTSVRPMLLFSGGILALSSLVIYLCWREDSWIRVAGIQKMLDAQHKEKPHPPISRRELTSLMDELLDERLANLERNRRPASPGEPARAHEAQSLNGSQRP